MKRLSRRFLSAVVAFLLLFSAAGAEWKLEKEWFTDSRQWESAYVYYENGKKVDSFSEMTSVEIPDEVTVLSRYTLKDINRDFVIKCSKGSYAETFAKQYGFQYDNGEKKVVGNTITDLAEKADWILENYVADNYKGSALTDREKARVLHDWLTTNATYDYYGLRVEERENTYKAEGVLLDGTGVCDSYAQAYSYLLTKAGIVNRYITGDTTGNKSVTNHAWDLVLIDGQWYFTDVTWDDPNGKTAEDAPITTGFERHSYFLVSDAELKDLNSTRIWDDQVSSDQNKVGFVITPDGTYYYGDVLKDAETSTGWLDIEYNDEYTSGYYQLYDPIQNAKVFKQEGKYFFNQDGTMAIGWADISKARYNFGTDGRMRVGWISEEDTRYHLAEDGKMDTGWTDLTEKYSSYNKDTGAWEEATGTFTYYFGTDGKMHVGWVDRNGKRYHLASNGRMEKDAWVQDGSDKYHVAQSGAMDTGWTDLQESYTQYNSDTNSWETKIGTFTYYFGADGKMNVGWIDTGSARYHLAANGRLDKNTWISDNGDRYHAQADGTVNTGLTSLTEDYGHYNSSTGEWETKKGTFTYYFDESGKMCTGWVSAGDVRYYMGTNGRAVTGLMIIESNLYYFNPDGTMATGWITVENERYYLGDDGIARTGFQKIGENKYYFYANGRAAGSGWVRDDNNNRYYLNENGMVLTGLQIIGDHTFLLDEEGVMQTGLQKYNDHTYYFGYSGPMAVLTWVTVENERYYFGADGAAVTGIQTISEKNYYFDSEGRLGSGWLTLGDDRYYINANGSAATGIQVIEGKTYGFDAEGKLSGAGWMTSGSAKYYLGSDGIAQTGFQTVEGKKYYFRQNGALGSEGWLTENQQRYYLDETGAAATGWKTIDGENYYFEADGSLYNRTPGDITDDGKIDGRDSVRLMKWLAGEEDDSGESVTIRIPNGDLNHDKEVDELDLLRLMQYFGGEVEDLE